MKPWGQTILLLTSATLLLAGCALAPAAGVAPATGASPLVTPTAAAQTEATPAASTDGAETPAGAASEDQPVTSANVSTAGIPGDILNSVLEDAAQRLGVAADELVVTRAEAVTWPDGSLGCPEPGMFYTQALVDGYWIVIEAGSQSLDYRVTGNGNFRLCDMPQPGSSVQP
jgi:hypothetical protein